MSNTTNAPASTVQYQLVTATGNIALMIAVQATLSPALVPTSGGGAEQSFAIQGILAGDIAVVSKPTVQDGLGIGGTRTAANTLYINFTNASGGDITPTASQVYTVLIYRPYSQAIIDGLPTSLPTP